MQYYTRFTLAERAELLAEVYRGVSYVDGRLVSGENIRRVAA